MEYTKGNKPKVKTLGDVWAIFERHGLKSDYCPHCDQFTQARVLQEQDEIISDMYEALRTLVEAVRNNENARAYQLCFPESNAVLSLAKAESKSKAIKIF